MWNGVFNSEKPFWRAMGTLCGVSILNVLTLLCCVPVITAGASITACASVMDNMALGQEGIQIPSAFFSAFRENFKKATIAWLIMAVILAVLLWDLLFGLAYETGLAVFFRIFGVAAVCAWTGVAAWLFPIIARYDNGLKAQFSNAVGLAITQLPRTLGMVIITLVLPVLCMLNIKTIPAIVPLMALIGWAGLSYLRGLLRKKVYEKYS